MRPTFSFRQTGPGTNADKQTFILAIASGGSPQMDSNTHFFTVWAHRSAKSIFGSSSNPVIRNGEFLCFDNEDRARASATG
jgi:hypothetical protein